MDLLFRLPMHSLGVSCVCPDGRGLLAVCGIHDLGIQGGCSDQLRDQASTLLQFVFILTPHSTD